MRCKSLGSESGFSLSLRVYVKTLLCRQCWKRLDVLGKSKRHCLSRIQSPFVWVNYPIILETIVSWHYTFFTDAADKNLWNKKLPSQNCFSKCENKKKRISVEFIFSFFIDHACATQKSKAMKWNKPLHRIYMLCRLGAGRCLPQSRHKTKWSKNETQDIRGSKHMLLIP